MSWTALLCGALLLTACHSDSARPDPPTDPHSAILIVDRDRSMAAPAEQHALPELVLLGDGTAVTRGSTDGVLLTGDRRTLTADEQAELYRRADAAGLFADRDFPADVTDAAVLTVRITAGRTAYRTTVVQPTPDDNGVRGRIIRFADAAVRAGAPAGPYRPTRAVVVVVAAGDDTSDVRPWPLPVPLSQLPGAPHRPCWLVPDRALPRMLELARSARAQTRWLVEGQRVALLVRPILPHEHSCADLIR